MMRIASMAIAFGIASFAIAEEPRTNPEKLMITHHLPIPPRLQWTDRAGYCGECSIQLSALYYGNYVSQFVCREIIDSDQEQDVLVQVNADKVLKALRLKYEDFDTAKTPTPQYKTYLEWTKRHLYQGHPVIITVFDQDDNCWDYDHIVVATGFTATHHVNYHPDDTLAFHDLLRLQPRIRPFKTLHDTREMKGNGAEYYFCIPERHNFGCAITGIEDQSKALLPIRVTVDREDEPDVVNKQSPVKLKLGITVRDLKAGTSYVLYRYDDHRHLPDRDYHSSKPVSTRQFVAKGATHEFTDECLSNGASFYRCLPTGTNSSSSAK